MYILDTHTLLWYLFDNDQLSTVARQIISDKSSRVFVSYVSFWKIGIKIRIGKLNYTYNTLEFIKLCQKECFNPLPIKLRHINEIQTLPLIHRDPFDRMLIAQTKVEDMTLITCDQYIPQYPIKTIW